MEIPYRSSNAGSEGQRSSLAGQSVSPTVLIGATNSSAPPTPTKVASVVSNVFNRSRQRSPRTYVPEEMKWSIRRKSSKREQAAEEIPLDQNSSEDNSNDCRVSVV